MDIEPSVRFPVTCPVCRNEVLATFRIAYVSAALIAGEKVQLYAICHDAFWYASSVEEQQLREYLGIVLPHGRSRAD